MKVTLIACDNIHIYINIYCYAFAYGSQTFKFLSNIFYNIPKKFLCSSVGIEH